MTPHGRPDRGPQTRPHDVLVIGAGGAGLRAAIEARGRGRDVGLVCKSLLGKAHTVMAEGGVAAALGHVAADDTWQIHFRDTMVGGKLLNNPRMAELHAMEAPDRVRELELWGAVFDRTRDGRILQRPFGGHSHPRLAHVGDRTGLEMIRTLQDRAVALGIEVYMECTITRLITGPDGVTGAFGYWRTTGQPIVFPAKADRARDRRDRQGLRGHLELVGVQRRRPGAGLRGRRRADRHGVRPVPPDRHGLAAGRPRPARHRGGPRRGRDPAQQGRRAVHVEVPARGPPRRVRRDRRGGRALGDRPVRGPARPTRGGRPSCRPATTSRGRSTPRSSEGRGSPHGGVFLDISYLPAEHVRRKLPSMYEQFKELADVDITKGPMEVGPTTHYVMGGIRVDAETGATTVAGPVRGGRGGRRDARREPARRQLAVGPARVRGADRRGARRPHAAAAEAEPYVDPVQVQAATRASSPRRSSGPTARTRTRSSATSRTMMQRLVGIFRDRGRPRRGARRAGRAAPALAERRARRAAGPTTRAGTSSSSCATC